MRTAPAEDRRQRAPLGWFLGFGVVIATVLAGYVGFRWAATLELSGQAGAGLVALAGVTGVAVVFSPCSFPLLVTLFAVPDQPQRAERSRDGVLSALAIATGAATFLLLTGVAVGVAGEGIASAVSFSSPLGRLLRGVVAVVLVTAGLVQLGVIAIPLSRFAGVAGPLERHRVSLATTHRRRAQVLYGFSFVVAGFG